MGRMPIKPPWASFWRVSGLLIVLVLFVSVFPGPARAEEVASYMYRYGEREVSTGYYEEYEVKPTLSLLGGPVSYKGLTTIAPGATPESLQWRTYLTDSHWNVRYYEKRECISCHPQQAWDRHTVRSGIRCHQCHGRDPIAGIKHYYSPMNPIRRHSYVCAKCHEGANTSFAMYAVHEPPPTRISTLKTFPMLFYAFWMMVAIAGGTFLVFLPHTVFWGIRELLMKKEEAQGGHKQ